MRAVWLDRVLRVAALIGLAALCVVFARTPAEDLRGYVTVGNAVLSRLDVYRDTPPGLNTWPPFFSLVCVPLGLLARWSEILLRYVWTGLNLAALVVAVDLVSRSVYGRSVASAGKSRILGLSFLEILVPVVLTTAYIGSNLEHQQVNIFIFALVLAGLLLDDCGKPVRGGIALGAAVAMKVMPVLFLAYWVYRRRWRAMISGTLATLGFSLSPILVFGWRQFAQGVVLWIAVVRKGWGAGEMNLSLLAMLDRIIGHRYIPFVSPGIERLDFSGDPMVRIVWILLLATIALACLLTFRGRKEPGTWEIRAEWSVVFLVSALAGPVTWKHYLVVALLGNTLLWAACLSSRLRARTRMHRRAPVAVFRDEPSRAARFRRPSAHPPDSDEFDRDGLGLALTRRIAFVPLSPLLVHTFAGWPARIYVNILVMKARHAPRKK